MTCRLLTKNQKKIAKKTLIKPLKNHQKLLKNFKNPNKKPFLNPKIGLLGKMHCLCQPNIKQKSIIIPKFASRFEFHFFALGFDLH
jgi:hypothetical protein